ncbi:MAG: glutathione S-transferase N-terminal domain-containing protein [Actinomycetia bacterium]|nr:glutathione S-transferase N-terminal domain-containing protein [Actinomycetes bacterium]
MKKVLVYSTPTCPYCARVKDYLSENGVRYDEVDISSDQKNLDEMVKKSKQMGIPVIDFNGRIVIGFEKEAIDEAIKEAALNE